MIAQEFAQVGRRLAHVLTRKVDDSAEEDLQRQLNRVDLSSLGYYIRTDRQTDRQSRSPIFPTVLHSVHNNKNTEHNTKEVALVLGGFAESTNSRSSSESCSVLTDILAHTHVMPARQAKREAD